MATLTKLGEDYYLLDPNNKSGMSFRGLNYIIATTADLVGFMELDLENCDSLYENPDCEVLFRTNGKKVVLIKK